MISWYGHLLGMGSTAGATIVLTPTPVVMTLSAPAITLGFGTKTLTPTPVIMTLSAPAVTLPTLTLLPPIRVSEARFLVQWETALSGPFYVWRDGQLVTVTHSNSVYIASDRDREDVIFDVFATPTERPLFVRSNRLKIEWTATTLTREYRVERNIASVWTTQATIKEDGQSQYAYRTFALDDDTLQQLRVIPVGTNGEDGTALTLTAETVRHPDPPFLDITFNDTAATLTIAEV